MSGISIDTLIQVLSLFVAVITFLVAHLLSSARDRRTANWENYQRLELASIDLFRFEADHLEIVRALWEDRAAQPARDTAEWTVFMNYVCQHLNLFEMALRFRREKIVPPEVFGSWVIWFLTLARAPGFRLVWEDLKCDYTRELREIFNEAMIIVDEMGDEDAVRRHFFAFVGETIGCDVIRQWQSHLEDELTYVQERKVSRKKLVADDINCAWLAADDAEAVAQFMADNMDPAYISHGELMDGRALTLSRWNPDLKKILVNELNQVQYIDGESLDKLTLAVAKKDGAMVAVALVELETGAGGGYAILSDLIVDSKWRDSGIGNTLLSWLEAQLQARQVTRVFLESGLENTRAHRFFHQQGYATCSVNMLKELTAV